MSYALVSPLVLTPSEARLGALGLGTGAAYGMGGDTGGDTGYGTAYDGAGFAARTALADPEGRVNPTRGGVAKLGPSPAPSAPLSRPTLRVSPLPQPSTPSQAPSVHRYTVPLSLGLSRGLNAREHPMARHRRVRSERLATAWALTAARIPHRLGPCTVRLTRLARGKLDSDNLQGAFKAVRDEIAAYLRTNDGPKGGIEWVYGQGYAKQASVIIDIEVTQ